MFEQVLVRASDRGPKAPQSLGGHIRHLVSKAYRKVCKHMSKISESMLGYLEYFSKFCYFVKSNQSAMLSSVMLTDVIIICKYIIISKCILLHREQSLLGCNCSNKNKSCPCSNKKYIVFTSRPIGRAVKRIKIKIGKD